MEVIVQERRGFVYHYDDAGGLESAKTRRFQPCATQNSEALRF